MMGDHDRAAQAFTRRLRQGVGRPQRPQQSGVPPCTRSARRQCTDLLHRRPALAERLVDPRQRRAHGTTTPQVHEGLRHRGEPHAVVLDDVVPLGRPQAPETGGHPPAVPIGPDQLDLFGKLADERDPLHCCG